MNTKVLKFMRSLSRYLCLNTTTEYTVRLIPFILTHQSMGEMGKINPVIIVCFNFSEALNGAFKMQFFFSRASFLHLIKDTGSMKGHAAQIFFLSEKIVKQCL